MFHHHVYFINLYVAVSLSLSPDKIKIKLIHTNRFFLMKIKLIFNLLQFRFLANFKDVNCQITVNCVCRIPSYVYL